MASATALIGSTGLTGSNILSTLLEVQTFQPVTTISRRAPKSASAILNAIVEGNTTKWASSLKELSPVPSVVFSALGTTRAQAGGVDQQWKIDHDLNIELIKAAKEAGTKTFVFISSAGINGPGSSMLPYSKMKLGVEDAIKEQGFTNGIVLRPGAIMGAREQDRGASTKVMESVFHSAIRGLGKIHKGIEDNLGQDALVIARAAVRAAQLAEEGKAPSAFWIIERDEIVKYGRKEWQVPEATPTETKPEPAAPVPIS